MKILLAVMGAEKLIEWGMHDLIRETWAQDAHLLGDFRFFVGRGETVLHPDTVRVDAPDDKDNLIYKVVEMCRWMVEQDYDMMLKVDSDTYVNCALMATEWLGWDYIGAPVGKLGERYGPSNVTGFFQGSSIWLSRKACEIVVNEVVSTMNRLMPEAMKYNGLIAPYPHSEDLWIGQVLGTRVISFGDTRYTNGPLTFHFQRTGNSVFDWMRKLHEARPDAEKMKAIHESR